MMRGIVYCAQGQSYLAEALTSTRSSLRHNAVPHLIFTDGEAPEPIAGLALRNQPPSGNPFADKISAMIEAPFERVLYLDTDTYVAADVTGIFDLLDRFDVAIAHAPGYLGCDDPEVPPAFYEFNSGVVAYRRTPDVLQLLADWRATYLAWFDDPPFPYAGRGLSKDQPALRRVLWRSRVALYVIGPEFNYRTVFPGRLVGPVKIIHGRAEDYEALVREIDQKLEPRLVPRLTAR